MQRITFTTNTGKNTLAYVKLLLQSLKENLDSDEHEILVFVDDDNENTLEYLLSIKDTFKDLTIIKNNMGFPIGYQRNKTLLTEYAKHDIISYLQSDMVIGPHYDTEVLKHAKKGRILSATRVEPPLHGPSALTITKDFGVHPETFDMTEWNQFSNSVKREELTDYFFSPITYYKEDWMRLGGYDTVFRRSREDSDLVQRCLHADIEMVQTFSANVYHFTCVSSRGKNWFDKTDEAATDRTRLQQAADSVELARFIRKWGNFNHGEQQLFKLDADVVLVNMTNINEFRYIEPFFNRVWVDSPLLAEQLIEIYDDSHYTANTLFGVTDIQWDVYKHLFNRIDYNSIILVGEPSEYSIKVTIDFSKIHGKSAFIRMLPHMYDMMKDYDAGEYEIDGILISIREIKILPAEICVENPPFDYTLLTIY